MEGKNKATLWDDLKVFYDEFYSADRIKLVVQVKTEDNMKEVKKWVTESFNLIPNKNLGRQDFSKIANDGSTTSPSVGSLPYSGNEHEMVVMNSYSDLNKLSMLFSIKSDLKRFEKQSL